MTHDLADLFAELDAAKLDLARSVKRCRTLIADRRMAPIPVERPEPATSAFGWQRPRDP